MHYKYNIGEYSGVLSDDLVEFKRRLRLYYKNNEKECCWVIGAIITEFDELLGKSKKERGHETELRDDIGVVSP